MIEPTLVYDDGYVRLIHADVLAGLRSLPERSVHTVVTSPPYWSLRDYGVEPTVWGGHEACEHSWVSQGTAEGYTALSSLPPAFERGERHMTTPPVFLRDHPEYADLLEMYRRALRVFEDSRMQPYLDASPITAEEFCYRWTSLPSGSGQEDRCGSRMSAEHHAQALYDVGGPDLRYSSGWKISPATTTEGGTQNGEEQPHP